MTAWHGSGFLRRLQDRPGLLEWFYSTTRALLRPLAPGVKRGGAGEKTLVVLERAAKGALFGCRMCGQCTLHSTGMTCPMTCPKNLRNGPCGGVRPDGHCEVVPEMPCVWVQAWERSQRMPRYGGEILRVLPPLDRRLQGSSAWLNDLAGPEGGRPQGWAVLEEGNPLR